MKGLAEFVAAWDDPGAPMNRVPVTVLRSPAGNLNSRGMPGVYEAHALPRWHPRFAEALEDGIRELVMLLVTHHGWITYTSCEGHFYRQSRLPPVERHVGLLPRSTDELREMKARLALVRSRTLDGIFATVYVAIVDDVLEDGEQRRAVVDLFFRRSLLARWQSYFRDLEPAYRSVVLRLRGALGP